MKSIFSGYSLHFNYPFTVQLHCGHQIKIKLICRLTKDRDKTDWLILFINFFNYECQDITKFV